MDVALRDKIGNLGVPSQLTEKQLDDLQWVKEFMDNYERKRRKRDV